MNKTWSRNRCIELRLFYQLNVEKLNEHTVICVCSTLDTFQMYTPPLKSRLVLNFVGKNKEEKILCYATTVRRFASIFTQNDACGYGSMMIMRAKP